MQGNENIQAEGQHHPDEFGSKESLQSMGREQMEARPGSTGRDDPMIDVAATIPSGNEQSPVRSVVLLITGEETVIRTRCVIVEAPDDSDDLELEEVCERDIGRWLKTHKPRSDWEELDREGIAVVDYFVDSNRDCDGCMPDIRVVRGIDGHLRADFEDR